MQKLSPCLTKHHLVFVFQSIDNVDSNKSYEINSVNFAIWLNNANKTMLNISLLDEHLRFVKFYDSFEKINLTFALTYSSNMSNKYANTTKTARCLCSNGQVKLRVGIIANDFYVFDNSTTVQLYNNLYETLAQNVFFNLASSLGIRYIQVTFFTV